MLCPGCGGTRAIAALLRGDVHEALQWNALVTLIAPVAALLALGDLSDRLRGSRGLMPSRVPAAASAALLVVAVLFGIWRNLA